MKAARRVPDNHDGYPTAATDVDNTTHARLQQTLEGVRQTTGLVAGAPQSGTVRSGSLVVGLSHVDLVADPF